MKIYIAGPMRGLPNNNVESFDSAEAMLLDAGWDDVINPAQLDRDAGNDPTQEPSDEEILKIIQRDLDALIHCDSIWMLSGWENSLGASAEHSIAVWLDLSINYPTESILDEAERLVNGDRNNQYGPPSQDFQRIATMWGALKNVKFTPSEVAAFMICVKLSRNTHQQKRDNWVDIAGYSDCGSRCDE